jgi:hypothetical protein
MIELQKFPNLKKIHDLYQFIEKKEISKFEEIDNVVFYYLDYIKPLIYAIYRVNQLTKKYTDELLPVLELKDNYGLFLYEEKYVKISFDLKFENIDIKDIFSTPQEVWEHVIKPDIEEYYGIKIEE